RRPARFVPTTPPRSTREGVGRWPVQIGTTVGRMRSAEQILAEADVIAVVGASREPWKPSHSVPLQILRHGWRIIPVNPFADEVFGVKTVPTLADIGEPVDLVDIFRPAADAVG